MLMNFFKKLEESKWLPWVGMSPFIIIPFLIALNGETWRGLGLFAFFASAFAGIILGGKSAAFISSHALKVSEGIRKGLIAGGGAFGLLFLPILVGNFTNAHMATEIGMHSVGAHFLWACCGAGLFFAVSSTAK